MDRKQFIKSMALLPLTTSAMTLKELENMGKAFGPSQRMPVLFLGHGSPMNAIEENEFVTGFRNVAKQIPKPQAILCISAHWETRGTYVTGLQSPPTIHDFGGFPKALFEVQYPASGSPELAKMTQEIVKSTSVGIDQQWGFDHGAWSVVKHLYPKADVPMIQMSIDYTKDARYHYALAKELSSLRNKGVLIIGSGNMVHNLRMISWEHMNTDNYAFDWTLEASSKMRKWILEGNHEELISYAKQGRPFQLAIPTPEHYFPLMYVLGLKDKADKVALFNDKAVAGSLTMTSVSLHA
ncbi:MAG: 4,5-DOPA dioxygenase extradiol [Bacteroidia bacterium]|nr:4,5-DOPA dioxygenase extradiol [Bacteroidia bacterium]